MTLELERERGCPTRQGFSVSEHSDVGPDLCHRVGPARPLLVVGDFVEARALVRKRLLELVGVQTEPGIPFHWFHHRRHCLKFVSLGRGTLESAYSGRVSTFSVLVADDDGPIRRMLERTLAGEDFTVRTVADGGAALAEVERLIPDVIVLDVAMPGLDGLAVCRRLRAKGIAVPVLLLTARDAVAERVAGLEAGADDYLVKPFASEELVARLQALLRRNRPRSNRLAFRDVVLDVDAKAGTRGGRDLDLTAREAELLEFLLLNQGVVVTRQQALGEVWTGGLPNLNVVDRYVAYLRCNLGDPTLISTVRGVGFRLG